MGGLKRGIAVPISVNGVSWYYQTFYDGNRSIDCVNLYDKGGSFVRTFIDFNDMIEFVQSQSENSEMG